MPTAAIHLLPVNNVHLQEHLKNHQGSNLQNLISCPTVIVTSTRPKKSTINLYKT